MAEDEKILFVKIVEDLEDILGTSKEVATSTKALITKLEKNTKEADGDRAPESQWWSTNA